jgi:hypothetical protein
MRIWRLLWSSFWEGYNAARMKHQHLTTNIEDYEACVDCLAALLLSEATKKAAEAVIQDGGIATPVNLRAH